MSNKTVIALCGGFGLFGWMIYGYALRGQIGEDSMVFHTAVRAWLEGAGDRIYDGAWLTAEINARFAGWLSAPIRLHPWIYPPSFQLLLLPFGYLPFAVAYPLFQATGFAALAAAACSRLPMRSLIAASLLLSPATAANVLLGQNGFLTAALLIGGARLLRPAPVCGGVLLGLLSYKPQFCFLVPVALLAGHHRRAAAAALITAATLVIASAAVFGVEPWLAWFRLITGGGGFVGWSNEARLVGMSVYADAAFLGASPAIANSAQAMAILLSAAAVHRAFSSTPGDAPRLAVLLTASFLAAPHAANYDAILLSAAAVTATSDRDFNRGAIPLLTVLWLCPLFNPPGVCPIGLATPLLVLTVIGVLLSCRSVDISEPERGR